MWSGNLSSTATAFTNLSNATSEVGAYILQAADTSDSSPSTRYMVFGTIILIGIAICCLRRPTPWSLLCGARDYISGEHAPLLSQKNISNQPDTINGKTDNSNRLDTAVSGLERVELEMARTKYKEAMTSWDSDPSCVELTKLNLDSVEEFDMDTIKLTIGNPGSSLRK